MKRKAIDIELYVLYGEKGTPASSSQRLIRFSKVKNRLAHQVAYKKNMFANN
jgi:hypothetical protein